MKTVAYIVLLAVLTFCTGYFLSQWWIVAFIGFIVALVFKESMSKSGIITLLVVSLVWFVMAYSIDINNESILSGRIGNLFGGLNSLAVTLISALVGGIVAFFGALTGASLNATVENKSS